MKDGGLWAARISCAQIAGSHGRSDDDCDHLMRIHQIIFLALVAVAFVVGCMKAPAKMIGGVSGGLIGVLIPFLCSQIYVRGGGDPTAAGAFPFLCFITIPVGIALGVFVASLIFKRQRE
jgi:hypothetical protein